MTKRRFIFTFIFTVIIGVLTLMVLWSPGVLAEETVEGDDVIQAVRVQEKITIDGELSEKVWQTPPLKKKFISYQPRYGDVLPMDTLVWVAYDGKRLYFAFDCRDPEPDKIKTTINKRDNISGDDWVSVAVDATGSGQTSYILYVNPNGIQADSITTSIHDEEDISPDFVWKSAAKLTDTGYRVEIALPLKSISFKSGKEVKMGILFRRNICRLSYTGAWPKSQLNRCILDSQAAAVFKNLKRQVKFEVLPSVTHSNNRDRVSETAWGESDKTTQVGIGLKYGITSSVTAEIAVNPDFSQVESDAFQVEVNQRYPLFYSEKRPFFMEGADIFNFWTYVYGYFPKAVHTRQIVDPAWGAKVTGTVGKFSFGVLSAGDEAPGRSWDFGINPNEGENALFGIARGKFSLGSDNYVGFLYTGSDFGNQYNHVFGADAGIRIAKRHRVRASFIHSASRDDEGNVTNGPTGNYGTFVYTYGSKSFQWVGILEHIGRELRVDSAYLQRTGLNMARMWTAYNFYTNEKKITWLKRISPEFMADYIHDLNTNMDDYVLSTSLNFQFIKQAYFILTYQFTRENWQGIDFDLNLVRATGQIRLTNWLRMAASFYWRQGIYYYGDPAFKGDGYITQFILDLQPSRKLSQYFRYTHNDLSSSGDKLYNVNIFYSKTKYQFNKYFFLRAILQYDSYQKKLLTDFLASFTLIPGTVLHVGYGGLYYKGEWLNDQLIVGDGNLYNTKRSFFAKVSYLWRL